MSARLAGSFRAPWWLPGGHAQTIVPARLLPAPRVAYRRERWETPDDDFVDVDFALPEPASEAAPLLVLFHGLEGNSNSHYARGLMQACRTRRWRGLVVHFRGCSGVPNRQARAYHSGDSQEIDWILRRVAQRWPLARRHAVGISLGGNALAKWTGERGTQALGLLRSLRGGKCPARSDRRGPCAGPGLQSAVHAHVPRHLAAQGHRPGRALPRSGPRRPHRRQPHAVRI